MPNETQETVSLWAEETFGPAGSNLRVAARANEEMAELLRCLSADAGHAKAAEEAADVVIVLCRVATRLGHTGFLGADLANVPCGCRPTFYAAQANSKMARAFTLLEADPNHIDAMPLLRECRDLLAGLCVKLVTDLAEEVDRKMATNRARVWRKDGTGHGYHVREGEAQP